MMTYRSGKLSEATEQWLRKRQELVDAEPDHASRYQRARHLFANKRGRAFDEIRERLASLSPPGSACFYCERDRYRDIDHVRPIRYYPEGCFDWQNYVYSCSICNQDMKRDRFGVVDDGGRLVPFDRSWPSDQAFPQGVPALIDIRHEDPLDFLFLDLETGRFVAMGDGPVEQVRANFTRELFRLDADDLSRIRRQAYRAFIDYLARYRQARDAGDEAGAERILAEIRELPHPTVLAEMMRQAKIDPQLASLVGGKNGS